ncbi:hypothetical protein ALC57_03076 [Trachymyrmex cornetzi]|uniref:Uncharacterized protein n=1 Tax=Trachymyrmex cornetzi TaxID=471704 RepID=A0A151JN36_9HYME|nr:hypothetical protein ALC57_03076 [Trachymyrmex cornetzi]
MNEAFIKFYGFFWRGIHKLSDRWEKCIAISNTSNKIFFIIFMQ